MNLSSPSKRFSILLVVVFLSISLPNYTSAQNTSCLKFPSGTSAPSGYAPSWDVFDSARTLLVKSNCPSSGTTLNLTVGRGDASQLVYNFSYSYHPGMTPPWQSHSLSGTISPSGWLAGVGTGTLTAPDNASDSNPFFFVGYTCQNRSGVWKCGCVNTSCTEGKWQLQAYKGIPPSGTTGGSTTGGGAIDTSAGWPSNANPNLPLGGVFYGNPLSGEAIWPLEVGKKYDQYSQAFRAEKSGTIERIQTDNRFPRPSEVGHYGKGRGGKMTVEIRTDDGTAAHKPTNTVIGRSGVFIPKDEAKGEVMDVALSEPATIVAGKIYHVVNTQLAFDEGSQSINANWIYASAKTSLPGGPYFGKNLHVYYGNNNSWVLGGSSSNPNDYLLPFVSVKYTDGSWIGTGGITHGRADTPFGGSRQVRQIFTVQDVDRATTGLWMRLFKKPGTTAPLNIKIVSGSNTVIETSLDASKFDAVGNQDTDPFDWVYWQFPNVVTLQKGSTYSIVMSSSGQYEIHQIVGDYILVKNDRNHWMNANGQISTNSGSTWASVDRCYGSTGSGIVGCELDKEGDFPLLFTIQGMPKQIQ